MVTQCQLIITQCKLITQSKLMITHCKVMLTQCKVMLTQCKLMVTQFNLWLPSVKKVTLCKQVLCCELGKLCIFGIQITQNQIKVCILRQIMTK